jgi:hypothetical protein
MDLNAVLREGRSEEMDHPFDVCKSNFHKVNNSGLVMQASRLHSLFTGIVCIV